MKLQPVIIISPWIYLAIKFWKPLVVMLLIFMVLVYAAVFVFGTVLKPTDDRVVVRLRNGPTVISTQIVPLRR